MKDEWGGEDQTLRHKRVLIAASVETGTRLAAGLQALGATTIPFQALEIRRFEDKPALDAAVAALAEYAWVIFTSANGVRFFIELLEERGVSPLSMLRAAVCAVGPATAQSLRARGFCVDLVPEEFVAEGVLKALADRPGGLAALAGRRILLPRAREARLVLPRELAAAGARVDVLPCYESLPVTMSPHAIRDIAQSPPDLLIFTSSANLSHFVELFATGQGTRLLQATRVAVLGPVTAQTAQSHGKTPDILPAENTVDSLLGAIREYFSCGKPREREPAS
jgi:uroporphyrinogen III methyltransferase / synthase